MPRKLIAVLFFALSFTQVSRAALVFETDRREAQADYATKEITFTFPFKNTGEEPVSFIFVNASCSCTFTDTDKEVYQPGESGVITAHYSITQKGSPQRTSILYKTNLPNADVERLFIKVNVPQAIDLDPQAHYWYIDEPTTETVFELTLDHPDAELKADHLEFVRGDKEAFKVRLEPGEEPGQFNVYAQPVSTEEPADATWKVNVTGAELAYPYARFFLRVAKPRPQRPRTDKE